MSGQGDNGVQQSLGNATRARDEFERYAAALRIEQPMLFAAMQPMLSALAQALAQTQLALAQLDVREHQR